MAWLLLPLVGGCAALAPVLSEVVPEQRHLALPDPAPLPPAPLPTIPPPETVSSPAPKVTPTELSLDEALRIALANSRVIRVLAGVTAVSSGRTIYDPAISNTAIDEARAVFDPNLVLNNTWSRTEQPQALLDPTSPVRARIAGTTVDQYDLNLGLSKRTVTGGTFRLDFNENVARFRPGVFPLNPQERSAVALSFTQPLLKGAGVDVNLSPIVIARINTEISYFQFKDTVQEMVRGVIEAYWAVVFARTDVWARKQQVEQGEFGFRLAEARLKAELGTAGAVAQARSALAAFKATLIASEANLLQREAALRNILGLPPTEPQRLTLTTPPMPERVEPRWEEIVKLAEERRPDLVELKLILEADAQVLLQANNQALPQVDLVSLYRWNGLEGETPTGARIGSGPGQFTDWTLGVNFSVPVGLRQARANLRRAELILVRDKANLQQGLHATTHELAGSLRNLAQFYEQYRAFQENRVAARLNLDQQLADFRAGRTIYINVLQAISDWGNSVSSEAQALAQYNTELATLERQTGTILETHGIRFMEERFRSIGPLGRAFPYPCYPASLPPTPNAPRYPVGSEPAETRLERESPPNPLREPNPPDSLPRPRFLPPRTTPEE